MSERFRPDSKPTGGSWLGFQEVQIVDFEDKTDKFAWADLFVDVTLKSETSQYPTIYQLKGAHDRESNGDIKDSSFLRRIYYLLDAVGFEGGPNKSGEWVDGKGEAIDDVVAHLNKNHTPANMLTDTTLPYYCYVYKEWSPKEMKAYTRVCPKIVKNEDKDKEDLKSYVSYMKSKGYIKEHIEGETPQVPTSGNTEFSGQF